MCHWSHQPGGDSPPSPSLQGGDSGPAQQCDLCGLRNLMVRAGWVSLPQEPRQYEQECGQRGTAPPLKGQLERNKAFIRRTEVPWVNWVNRDPEPEPRRKSTWWAKLCEIQLFKKPSSPPKPVKCGVTERPTRMKAPWPLHGQLKETCRRIEPWQWSNI